MYAEYHRHSDGRVVPGPAIRCIDPQAGAEDIVVTVSNPRYCTSPGCAQSTSSHLWDPETCPSPSEADDDEDDDEVVELRATVERVRALADLWDEANYPGMMGISTRIRATLDGGE